MKPTFFTEIAYLFILCLALWTYLHWIISLPPSSFYSLIINLSISLLETGETERD